MSSNNTMGVVPNPLADLSFLPPDIAFETQVARYILVGSLGALLWDIISNFVIDDYKLLFRQRINVPTIVFFASRLIALAFILTSVIFETTPIGHCQRFQRIVLGIYTCVIPSTSLLFLFRIRAIFNRNKFIVIFFCILWLSVFAGSLTTPFAVSAINIGPTDYCLNSGLKSYSSSAAITSLINDTCVFIAISCRMVMNAHADLTFKRFVKRSVSGGHLPAFSKAMLQGGQLYYLFTVGINAVTIIMVYVPGVPVTYRSMFLMPNVTVMNTMACHVFRSIKFGRYKYSDSMISSSTLTAKQLTIGSIPLELRRAAAHRDGTDTNNTEMKTDVEVTIEKTVQNDFDSSTDYRLPKDNYIV